MIAVCASGSRGTEVTEIRHFLPEAGFIQVCSALKDSTTFVVLSDALSLVSYDDHFASAMNNSSGKSQDLGMILGLTEWRCKISQNQSGMILQ